MLLIFKGLEFVEIYFSKLLKVKSKVIYKFHLFKSYLIDKCLIEMI